MKPRHKGIQGRPTEYSWKEWLTSKNKVTIEDHEYSATQRSMCVMIRQNARLLGVNVSVYPQEDGSIMIHPRGPREDTTENKKTKRSRS